ncbi:FecR domain-containing protein [Terriglobus sp. 2YAB30_2]|uniref:DUF6600 domain-containing protein n=1 Tax=Terriglobus sp. 2YAB30_2 TaxID=3233023 RepID=UPI003F950AD6
MNRSRVIRGILVALFVVVCGVIGLAGQQSAPAPGMRAARLSLVQGNVQVLYGDNTQIGEAQANLPLIEGQRIVTADDGQAEIEFEDGSIVRLTPQSALTLVRMNTDQGKYLTQLSLDQGMAYFELRIADQNGYFLKAGTASLTPVENSSFRVSLDQAPVEVAVMQGSLHVEREGGYSANIRTGEQFEPDAADSGRYFLSKSVRQDSWDNWNEERDQAAASEAAQRTEARNDYAQDSGYGWSDLDANGNWYDLPGYGRVWQPPMAVDMSWDPYGYGNWVWYPGYGYIWASGYGWGWTPFYCGSWSYWDSFGWGWMPAGGCRRWGWGYGGGSVWTVNVINPPRVWQPIRRPIPGPIGPGGVHPIVPVRRGPIQVHPIGRRDPRPVMFAGKQIDPLRPVGGPYTPRGGSAVGSSLQKDFPMRNRQPVMGTVRAPRDDSGRATRPSALQDNGSTPTPIQAQPVPPVVPGGWRSVSPGVNQGTVNQGAGNQGAGNQGSRGQSPQQPAQPVTRPAPGTNVGNPERPVESRPAPGHINQPPVQQQPRPQPVQRPEPPASWRQSQPAPQPRQSAPPPAPSPAPAPAPSRPAPSSPPASQPSRSPK